MAKSRKIVLSALAVLAGVAALWAGWPAETPHKGAAPVAVSATGDAPSASDLNTARQPVPAATNDTTSVAPKKQEDASSWRQLYAASDLFPRLLQLHQARRTGSYAAVRALNEACIAATLWSHYPDRDPLKRADVNHPDHAKRLAARERVTSGCGHMQAGGGGGVLVDVAAGDIEGQKFIQAFFVLQDARGKSVGEVDAALAEAVRQGHPEVMLMLHGQYKISQGWRGLISPEAASDARRAARIAEMRFTAPDAGPADQDIRLAFRCFMDGECSYRYDDVSDIADPQRRARILQTAAELEASLRSPDPVQALFRKR
ncbi:hypothetical protein J2X20_003213 [Pelomonas saccharophila]|uniref:Lipoprotein n=1 Tax=Roseateles saccharophilus TaxID=304 RepID=A0ABU1YNX2_ROSSA|nr:hypothetical protein [Roseateles saccharophilus]MDR7270555.1 hypothetical protein [Roseateles saccharophilus]